MRAIYPSPPTIPNLACLSGPKAGRRPAERQSRHTKCCPSVQEKSLYLYRQATPVLDIIYCESVFRESFQINESQLHTFFVYDLHRSYVEKCIFIMEKETVYVTPEVEVYEVLVEGMLCNSPMEGVGEEDGNGGFE